jgi:hypothetical protein
VVFYTLYFPTKVQIDLAVKTSICLTKSVYCKSNTATSNKTYLPEILANFVKRKSQLDHIISGGNTSHLLYLSYILILLSSDTELNPGPATPKYPCQTCNKAVTWRQRAVACDNCNLWYHTNCMGMNSAIYKALEPSNASWTCCQCGIPNFSTSLFESVIVESNNIYDSLRNQSVLSNTSLDNGNMRSPLHTSSPNHQANQRSKFPHNRNIRFATINFQSINAKKHSFWNFLDSSNPDIICGNETWRKPYICEILPDQSDYEIFVKTEKMDSEVSCLQSSQIPTVIQLT